MNAQRTCTNACTHVHTYPSHIQPAKSKLHSKRFESDLASRGTEGAIRRDSDTVEEGCVAIVVGLQPTVGQIPHLYHRVTERVYIIQQYPENLEIRGAKVCSHKECTRI